MCVKYQLSICNNFPDIRGSHMDSRDWESQRKNFHFRKVKLSRSKGVKFQLSSSNTRGRCAPARSLAEKFSYLKRVLGRVEMCVKFRLSISSSFRDMRGPKFTLGIMRPTHVPWRKTFHFGKVCLMSLNVCKISTIQSKSFRALSGPKFTLGGSAPPHASQRKLFYT